MARVRVHRPIRYIVTVGHEDVAEFPIGYGYVARTEAERFAKAECGRQPASAATWHWFVHRSDLPRTGRGSWCLRVDKAPGLFNSRVSVTEFGREP